MIIYHVYEDAIANTDGMDDCVQRFVRSFAEAKALMKKHDKNPRLIKHTKARVEKWTFQVVRHQDYEGTGQPGDIERDYIGYWHIEKMHLEWNKNAICQALNTWPLTDECYA